MRVPSVWSSMSAVGALALVACALAGPAVADPLDALRGGGVTLFLRHTSSDWAQEPIDAASRASGRLDGKDCRSQRNLSEEGRADARAIGLAVRGLRLPIGEVYAADLCRTVETARLAFGEPKTAPDATPGPASLAQVAAAVERIVRGPGPAASIRVLVGDYEIARTLFGVTLAEGDALVMRAASGRGVDLVGRIRASDWNAYAPTAAYVATPGAGPSKRF